MHIGNRGNRFRKQLVVGLFIDRDGFRIIDADKDTENVRFQVDRVALPASGEVHDFIAADPAIDENELGVAGIATIFRGDNENITVTQNVILVGVTTTIAIGYGISLE